MGASAALAGFAATSFEGFDPPAFAEVKRSYVASEAVLYDRSGATLHELRARQDFRALKWVGLRDISPALARSVVYSEDRRFFEGHRGVDWRSLARAAFGFARARIAGKTALRGGSTISMQVASMLDHRLRPGARARRSLWQKAGQVIEALMLERRWSKNEILEAYLNLVSFRGELQGVGAAARGLFGKDPHGLSWVEGALLAALLRAPNAELSLVAARACALAHGLWDGAGATQDCSLFLRQVEEARAYYSIAPREAVASQLAHRLLAQGKLEVRTTLDGSLQRFAFDALKRQLSTLKAKNVRDGAILVADNSTGEVLAYVGGSGTLSSAPFVDGVMARRQAGSTLKPFLYGLAFERRVLTPETLLDDSPLDIALARGIYRPQNYDRSFRGPVPARVALASSLNVPAVKTLELVGVDAFVGLLERLGFTRLRTASDYGPSLALGSADVTLFELVQAYRALAIKGIAGPLKLEPSGVSSALTSDQRSSRALSAEAAFLVSEILSDRENRGATFGLESPLATRFWSAVKTGTSKDMRDNWCIGFSRRHTVGVWIGNFSGEPMWNVSGVTGAAPVWAEIMDYLHRGSPEGKLSEVVRAESIPSGVRRVRGKWFLAGTEPENPLPTFESSPRIAYPPSGMIMAIDPDIPNDAQRVPFRATGQLAEHLRFILNGRDLGAAAATVLWAPERGMHFLKLVDQRSRRVLDEVRIEVR